MGCSIRAMVASLLLLGGGCGKTEPRSTEPAAVAPTADATVSWQLLVRIHRFGGGPAGLDHTLEVSRSGEVHLTGYDGSWCPPADAGQIKRSVPIDTRTALEPSVRDELTALTGDPQVTGFAGAGGRARAPEHDGVAAEVTLGSRPPVLVDGVREVQGKMGRLLDLDRELAKRFGHAASCN